MATRDRVEQGESGQMASNELNQKLPEVPLRWSDFFSSLEKLRHKSYSKNTTERYVKYI